MSELSAFDGLAADLALAVTPLKSIAVADKETCDKATQARREVKQWEKRIEEKRKELVGPLNDQVKRINEYAKKISVPIDETVAHIDGQLKAFERELERVRQEEGKKALEAKLKAEEEARLKIQAQYDEAQTVAMFQQAPEVAEQTMAKAESEAQRIEFETSKQYKDALRDIKANKVAGVRKIWRYEIIDPAQVPTAFLMVNESAISAAVKSGARSIQGVRIYEDTIITNR